MAGPTTHDLDSIVHAVEVHCANDDEDAGDKPLEACAHDAACCPRGTASQHLNSKDFC